MESMKGIQYTYHGFLIVFFSVVQSCFAINFSSISLDAVFEELQEIPFELKKTLDDFFTQDDIKNYFVHERFKNSRSTAGVLKVYFDRKWFKSFDAKDLNKVDSHTFVLSGNFLSGFVVKATNYPNLFREKNNWNAEKMQLISRALYANLLTKYIQPGDNIFFKIPKTYLYKIPGTKDEISDHTCVIVQEKMIIPSKAELNDLLVSWIKDEKIKNFLLEGIKHIQHFGLWDMRFRNFGLSKEKNNIYFIDLEQHRKFSDESFFLNDPILFNKCVLKGLRKFQKFMQRHLPEEVYRNYVYLFDSPDSGN